MKLVSHVLAGIAVAGFAEGSQVHLRHSRVTTRDPVGDLPDAADDFDAIPSDIADGLQKQVMAMASGHAKSGFAGGMDEVAKLIEGSLMPAILKEHNESQAELDALIKAYNCSAPDVQKGNLKQVSDARTPKKSKHDECRGAEDKAFVEKEECNGVLASLKSAQDAACGAVAAVKRDPSDAASQCKPAGAMEYGQWLEVNEKWFVEKNKEYKKLEGECNAAKAAYDAQKPICESKESTHKNKREECNVAQSALEDSYCTFQEALVESCTEYGVCYKKADDEYKQRLPVIKAAEESRMTNWRVYKRIACLLPILKAGGKADQIEECKKKVHETKHLNLTYAAVPDAAECPDDGPMPCDADYVQAVYNGLSKNAAAAECKACPGAAPANFVAFKPDVAAGTEVCAGDAVFEYTANWDCSGRDLTSIQVPYMGQGGWEQAFRQCAEECKSRDNCVSFNYPQAGGNSRCWIKHSWQKSVSRGWDCGGAAANRFHFFSKIPGQTCKSPPVKEPAWSLPQGIQNGYPLAKLPKSWKVFTDHPYGQTMIPDQVIPKDGDCMLWGAKSSANAPDFNVVAFGRRDVVAKVGRGAWENGAYWYLAVGQSFGFADTNQLSLCSCDIMDGNSPKRLCWHHHGSVGGWRAGAQLWLNQDQTWRKIVMSGPCSVA